jgi:hypothetical protein
VAISRKLKTAASSEATTQTDFHNNLHFMQERDCEVT